MPQPAEAEFIATFERTALADTLVLLQRGRERAERERARYGLTGTPDRQLPGAYGTVTVAGESHMAANDDTRALAQAAAQLRDQWLVLRRTREDLQTALTRRRLTELGNGLGAGLLRPRPPVTGPFAPAAAPHPNPLEPREEGITTASGMTILDPHDPTALTSVLAAEEARWRVAAARATARFPLLGPLTQGENPAEALAVVASGPDDAAARILSGELDRNLASIDAVTRRLTVDRIWSLPMVVDRTRRRLGLHPAQREYQWIEARLVARQQTDDLVAMAVAAVTFALWVLAAATAGTTTGLALAATGAVSNAAVAGHEAYDYVRRDAEAHAALDPADAIAADEPSLVWLAAALIGAGLDLGAVAHGWHVLRAPARAAVATRSAEDLARLARQAETVQPGLGQRVRSALETPAAGQEPISYTTRFRQWPANDDMTLQAPPPSQRAVGAEAVGPPSEVAGGSAHVPSNPDTDAALAADRRRGPGGRGSQRGPRPRQPRPDIDPDTGLPGQLHEVSTWRFNPQTRLLEEWVPGASEPITTNHTYGSQDAARVGLEDALRRSGRWSEAECDAAFPLTPHNERASRPIASRPDTTDHIGYIDAHGNYRGSVYRNVYVGDDGKSITYYTYVIGSH